MAKRRALREAAQQAAARQDWIQAAHAWAELASLSDWPDSWTLLKLSRAHRRSGDPDGAQRAIRRALELYPDRPEILREAADVAAARKEWGLAITYLTRIVDKARTPEARILVKLARAHRRAEQFDKAQAIVHRGLGLYPDDIALLTESAELASDRLDWAGAAARIERLLRVAGSDDSRLLLMKLSKARRKAGDVVGAGVAIGKAMALWPEDTEVLGEAAEVATAAGDWPDALDRWRRALSVLPEGPPRGAALVRVALVHNKAGDAETARQIIARALALHPEDDEVETMAAESAAERDDWATAARHWHRVRLRQGSTFPLRALVKLAEAERRAGRFGDAETGLAEAVAQNPRNETLVRVYAGMAAARRDWRTALARLEPMLRLIGAPSLETLVFHVRLYRLLGRLDDAGRALDRARAAGGDDCRVMIEGYLVGAAPRPAVPAATGLVRTGAARADVVICVRDAFPDVQACLRSVVAQSEGIDRVIVVDDASSAPTRDYLDWLARQWPRLEILRNEARAGYTRSANRGVRHATADRVVLLNSDTVVTCGWLAGLLDASTAGNAAAAGPLSNAATFQSLLEPRTPGGRFITHRLPDGRSPEDMAGLVRRHSARARPAVPMLNGFCMMLSRAAFDEVGGFDERRFPIGYGEENDFCLRLVKAGHRLVLVDDVFVYHGKSASFGLKERQDLVEQGKLQMAEAWPGFSYAYVADLIEELPALVDLRRAVADDLAAAGQPNAMAG